MANKIYSYENSSEFSYDTNKILVNEGIVSLKEDLTNVYACYHLNEGTGETVLDSSGNGRNGTPVNNPSSVDGKLNKCLSFNGSNQYVNLGNIANFERTDPFSVEFWMKTGVQTVQLIVTKFHSSMPRGWQIFISNQHKVNVSLASNSSNFIRVETNATVTDNNWHHVVVTYNGSSLANGVKIYLDNTVSNTIINNNLTDTILNTCNCQISGRNGTEFCFNGLLDEVVIYDKELSADEVSFRYNSGAGREFFPYSSDKPTIQPKDSWELPGLSEWFGFNETLGAGNQGNVGYQLSDDDGVNWRYWNGSSWVITSDINNYNSATVVGANISSFPTANKKILFRAILISDGNQQVELDSNEIVATVGYPPSVYAGADKECNDHQTIKPFSDAVISDPDGNIENATAWRKIESDVYTQILKGGYGTLQEAIRNFEYNFDNLGEVTCVLKITDEEGKSQEDSCVVTVSKYKVTFIIKDSDGNHLGNILCYFDDGTGWQMKNSPFTYEFEYKAGSYLCTFDKTGFISQTISVLPTTHTENITMQRLTVDPSAIADAVWDEIKTGHQLTNSFGKEMQDIKSDTSTLPTLIDKVTRVLGLSSENYRIVSFTYTGELLTSATIKIYPTNQDCVNDTNPIATYLMSATFDADGKCTGYRVIKE